ncbi:MAG: hypothetical protein ACLQAH_17245 [Limisphaerales bacterium]
MKTRPTIVSRRCRQRGSAVLILLILLVIMVMLSAANSSALIHLHGELNLLDHRQVERLNIQSTNTSSTAVAPAQLESK